MRQFFVSDFRKLLIHVFEAYYAMMILTIVAVISWPHDLPYYYYVPFAVAALVPIIKVLWCSWQTSHLSMPECLRTIGSLLFMCLVWPFFLLPHLFLICHPLDAGLHILLGIAVVPMAWELQSNLALVILWGVHSVLIVIALIERHFFKCWHWRDGRAWLISMQTVLLGTYVVDCLCEFKEGVGSQLISGDSKQGTELVDLGLSLLWLGLVCALALHVNWEQCVRYYRTWQNQHGSFRLERDGGGGGGGGRVAPTQEV